MRTAYAVPRHTALPKRMPCPLAVSSAWRLRCCGPAWSLRLSAPLAVAETPTPTPTGQPSNNPFADLEPVTLLIWLGSVLVALVAVLYAVERERRKHEG